MQTSNHKLTSQKETDLYNQLTTLLCDLDHPKAMAAFLKAFLTDTERSVLSKRLAIFCLLDQGKSYEAIKDELHVSSATISSMADQANQPAIKHALQEVKKDHKLDEILTNLGLK
jgi:Trp operon repressor